MGASARLAASLALMLVVAGSFAACASSAPGPSVRVAAPASSHEGARGVDAAARYRPSPFGVEPEATRSDRLAKLMETKAPIKWNEVPGGRSSRYGRAAILIQAPREAVRANVLEFAHYKDFAPNKFKASRVTDKTASGTLVYLQLPIMHGLVTLWTEALFTQPVDVAPEEEFVEGTLVRGNMKDFHVVWTMRSLPGGSASPVPLWTELRCDLLVTPHVPAPEDKVDEELRDAAEQAIVAIRDRSERSAAPKATR